MKLLIVTLLSLNLYSVDLSKPQMIPRMLKYKQSELNKYTCHSSISDKETFNSRDSFIAKISCDISCSDGNKASFGLTRDFVPNKLSLSPGDGSSSTTILWRSLGITLNVFKKQVCFDKAQSYCKDSSIKSFNASSIESGNWKLNQDITCKTKGVIRSPFDTKFKLNSNSESLTVTTPSYPFAKIITEAPINEIKEFLSSKSEALNMQKMKGCKKVLKIDSCFGDCVFESDASTNTWIETISTPEPFGEDSQSLCLDKFVDKIKHSSRAVALFKCEKLIWEYIRTSHETGESCAAIRYNSNCADLI